MDEEYFLLCFVLHVFQANLRKTVLNLSPKAAKHRALGFSAAQWEDPFG